MGQAFPCSKAQNRPIDLAFEQSRKDVDCPFRRFNQCEQTSKARFMPGDQGADAGVQSMERLAVSGKDEHVIRHSLTDRLERLQPIGEGIGFRFQRLNRNIG